MKYEFYYHGVKYSGCAYLRSTDNKYNKNLSEMHWTILHLSAHPFHDGTLYALGLKLCKSKRMIDMSRSLFLELADLIASDSTA